MSQIEKDLWLRSYEREYHTTLRVMQAFPDNKLDINPHGKRSALELLQVFIGEQAVIQMAVQGKIDFSGPFPPMPAAKQELMAALEMMCKKNLDTVRGLSDEQFMKPVMFPSGSGPGKEMRTADACWMAVFDMVHHRGQLSVYLRLAGGKVPSIYGPSGDQVDNLSLM